MKLSASCKISPVFCISRRICFCSALSWPLKSASSFRASSICLLKCCLSVSSFSASFSRSFRRFLSASACSNRVLHCSSICWRYCCISSLFPAAFSGKRSIVMVFSHLFFFSSSCPLTAAKSWLFWRSCSLSACNFCSPSFKILSSSSFRFFASAAFAAASANSFSDSCNS